MISLLNAVGGRDIVVCQEAYECFVVASCINQNFRDRRMSYMGLDLHA